MDEPLRQPEDLPEPAVRWRRPSLVWLIPLVAAIIGCWIALKAYREHGPTITITFQTAEGLEAGQTRIKYKDVEVGRVTAINLSPDFSQVVVTAELKREVDAKLSENTRFWVVRARIGTNGISGLGTLLAGAYIGMDPGPHGKLLREFKGLESAPILTPNSPGAMMELKAEKLGSLNIGSPVTFRQIHVGEVEGFDLDPDGQSVRIKIQIHAPYHKLIHRDTRFWDSGGVDLSLDANGMRLHTDSMVQLLLGGIAFENPPQSEPVEAPPNQTFTLFPSHDQALEPVYRDRQLFLVNFNESVRGLVRGAPVEYRGVRVGQVEEVRLEFHSQELEGRIPVLLALEPERFAFTGGRGEPFEAVMTRLVRKGFRAQLKPGSLLTGNLFVGLDFFPQAPARALARSGGFREIPTMPSAMGALLDNLARVAERLQKLPLEEVAGEVRATFPVLRETLQQTRALMARLDTETAPQAKATLAQAQTTLAALERTLDSGSPTQTDLRRALDQFAQAAQALRNLADTLERHPESMIFGKGKNP
ncbi:MAG: MlaD family protein [Holophaga sp.]|nr:MlaD family protein [Holophaga sp.]